MIKNRLLAAITVVALSIVPASYAAAGGSSFSVGIRIGGHGGHYSSHSRSHSSRHSYRSRGHSSHSYRSHSNYRAPNYGYRYRYEDHHGKRSYRQYSRPGRRSYGYSRSNRGHYQYSRSHQRSYGHSGYRSYPTKRFYRRSSDYYPHASRYSYAPVGFVSSSYCPTYGSSYRYGSAGYRNYTYRKYRGVQTYYGGYRGAYPAPVIINPITPDRSHTYDQSKPSIEDYRQWQREGDQAPSGKDFENDDHGTHITARDRAQMVEAWAFIGADEPRQALTLFATLCESNPDSAVIKAGYAVAAALSGDDRTAYWAMRRAVATGHGMVGSLPAAEGLDNRLQELAQAIEAQSQAQGATADRMFLLAGVQMLQHDEAAALASAEEAHRLGDRHQTLSQMLGRLRSQRSETNETAVAVK